MERENPMPIVTSSSNRNTSNIPARHEGRRFGMMSSMLVVAAGLACLFVARRGVAETPPAPQPVDPVVVEVARLRDTGAAALTALHDAASTAATDRAGAERRAAALDDENHQLRTRVAQLEAIAATSRPTGGADPAPKARVHTVRAGEQIQDALDKAKPGDVVVVAPAEYAQSVRIPKGVVLSLNGATLNGGGDKGAPAVIIGQSATLAGGIITGYVGGNERGKAIVRLFGDDATVDGVTIHNVDGCAIGGDAIQRPRIVNNTIRDITGSWIMFGGSEKVECAGAVVTGNTVERWNTAKHVVASGPGVNKFTRTVGATFNDNTFKDGFGPALWGDIGNRKYTIAGNTFSGLKTSHHVWDAIGIYMEISNGQGSVIERNTFRDIVRTGSAISIAESNEVVVRQNTVDACRIELRDVRDERSPAKPRGFYAAYDGKRTFVRAGLRDVTIEDNILLNKARADLLCNGGNKRVPGSWDGDSAKYLVENRIVWKNNKPQ
jgi:hypothetical protein